MICSGDHIAQTDRPNKRSFFQYLRWVNTNQWCGFYMRRFVFELGSTMNALSAKAVRNVTTGVNFRKRRSFWIVLIIGVVLSAVVCTQDFFSAPTVHAAESGGQASPVSQNQGSVLVLYSFGAGLPAYLRAAPAFISILNAGGISNDRILIEYLDLGRNTDAGYRKQMADLLIRKYSGKKIALIITVHAGAQQFLMEEGQKLLPGVPALSYLAKIPSENDMARRKMLVMPVDPDFSGTLKQALEMFPQTNQVFVVTGTDEMDKQIFEEARKDFIPWRGKLAFTYTSDLSVDNILKKVATLPPGSIVIYANVFKDGTGKSHVPRDVAAAIAKASSVPVFAYYDSILGEGVIGGSMMSFAGDGERAAKIALEILANTRQIANGDTIISAYNRPMYDWKQLKRWGVTASALPGDTLFINRPVSIWDQYKLLVSATIAGGFVLTAFTITLLLLNRRMKQQSNSLRESEQRFRNMFEKHSVVMLLVEPTSGEIVAANAAAAEFYGYTKEQLHTMNIADINDLDPDLIECEFTKAFHEERNYFIFLHKLSSGEIRTVEVHSTPIEVNDRPLLFSVVHDITERKRAEAKIAQLSEEQSIVLNHAGVGISFVQNRHQKWSNARMAEIFGYAPEEMCNANLRMFYASDEDYEQIGTEAYPVLASGESFEKNLQMRRSDGTLFPVRIVGKAINPADILVGSIWIVSDETFRHELEQKLQQSHDLLTSLSRQIPGTIYQFQLFPDGRTRFPYASDAIIDMYEVTPDDVREDATPVFNNLYPDDIGGVSESIMESARTLEPWEYDYRVNLPQKGVRWRHGFSRPQKLNDGSTLWHGFINDITAQKQLEFELAEARNAAESANKAKSEFLANMSHEIRTPMNGLLGMTQLMEMTDLTQEQQEYVASLKLSGTNLLSLVNDILDLSKIEAGRISIEPVEFNLRRALDDVYLVQKSAIFAKKLAFNVTVSEDMPTVIVGDQLRVKQIIHNLLGNAVKFTLQGSISIVAKVHERHDDSCTIQISVTDTGIGIAAGAFDQIFTPFVQEDGSTTRRFGGTGLGLTISRRLAELMGGNISVESTQGIGSSFILKLPFKIQTIQQTSEILPLTTSPVWDGPALRILLVEDNPVNLKFATVLLGKHGHHVVTAENGRESLEALEQGEFDLVLMDVQMPVMNGEEALRAIRAQEEGTSCHQKVIALTAHALRNERDRFLYEGFDGYLSKPVEQQELIAEMKRVMGL